MPRRFLLIVAAIALIAIGGALAASPHIQTATGVVVAVDAVSLTDVRSFTLRVTGGQTIEFSLGALQNGVEFPVGHLVEHIGSGGPIVVTYREENGVRNALRLADAPVPSGSPGSTQALAPGAS